MFRLSISPLLSLGNKSSAAPFAGAALQLIEIQKQHLALILGEKRRRREQMIKNSISDGNNSANNNSNKAKRVLKSQKMRDQELSSIRQVKEEFERKQGFSLDDDNDGEYQQQQQKQTSGDEDNELELSKSQSSSALLFEKQQQAEQLKEDFLEMLEQLRPLFHATKALKSSRLYAKPLYTSLKYFKLYDDPLFLQLSAALGSLDKNFSTRKGNNLMLWGEDTSVTLSIKKKRNAKVGGDNDDDDDEENRDFTNFGNFSNQHYPLNEHNNGDDDGESLLDDVDLEGIIDGDLKSLLPSSASRNNSYEASNARTKRTFERESSKTAKGTRRNYSFPPIIEKNMDTLQQEQEQNIMMRRNNSNNSNDNRRSGSQHDLLRLHSMLAMDRRQQALDMVKSRGMPTVVSMHEPSEYPAPDADQVALASRGDLVREMGVQQRPMAFRGHWVLREKGIAATKDTSAMDPW